MTTSCAKAPSPLAEMAISLNSKWQSREASVSGEAKAETAIKAATIINRFFLFMASLYQNRRFGSIVGQFTVGNWG